MADTRFLVLRRQTYYVAVEVPPSIRPNLGKKRLVRTLKTRSLETAQRRRWDVIADLRREIEAARSGQAGDPVVARAMFYRDAYAAAEKADEESEGRPEDLTTASIVMDHAEEEAARLEHRRPGAGSTFAGIFSGTATPLMLHVDRWLAEGGVQGLYEERTQRDHRRAVQELGEWLSRAGGPGATLQTVTRSVAGCFVSDHLGQSGRAIKTQRKTVSALASYWTHLRRRGHVSDDQRSPWAEQAPSKRSRDGGATEQRSFTDDEVRRLLASPPTLLIADFLRAALLTGMRREEIGRLRVGDVEGGVLIVRSGKTAAARRRVPVHPDLAELIERRCRGKSAGDYLFDDLTANRPERTDTLGKLFVAYRRKLGIQDGEGGRSRVNFHSARRWFITAALNAEQLPHMVSLVVGHKEGRQGMTTGRYWGGADDPGLRKVVEAVRLPSLESA